MADAVLGTDLRDALAVNPILDRQQATRGGDECRDHAFDRGRARSGEQHGGPLRGIELVHREQPPAGLVLHIEEFRLAMAQIGLQQAAADALGQRDRAGIEQQHYGAPPLRSKWPMKRDLTSTGDIDGRGRSRDVPGRVSNRAKRAASCGGESSQPSMCSRASVSSEAA